jgi:mono/diheme cytochrome c family protein
MNPAPPQSNQPQESEPTAGSARAPVWLFVLVAVLAFLGMGFLDNHGGGFHPRVYRPYNSIGEVRVDQPPTAGIKRLNQGRAAYATYCAPCHLESGMGNPGNKVPPLVRSEWVIARGPNRLIRIVLNGLQGPVTVDGKDFDSNGMFAWRDTITDDGVLAQILTFIRGNSEWGHETSEVTSDQVTKVRAETKDRGGQWTVSELFDIPEK